MTILDLVFKSNDVLEQQNVLNDVLSISLTLSLGVCYKQGHLHSPKSCAEIFSSKLMTERVLNKCVCVCVRVCMSACTQAHSCHSVQSITFRGLSSSRCGT